MTDYLSCADTAKLLRAALKEAFPGVKFSVKSSTYSGGASIRVHWVDGPRTARVEPIAQRFAGASFDGMIDLKSYHTSELNGRHVHFGADYVFCERSTSNYDAVRHAAGKLIRQRCRITPGLNPGADYFGNTAVDDLANAMARDIEYGQLNAAFRRVVLRESDGPAES